MLAEQENLGSIPASSKCFFSSRVSGGRMEPDTINLRALALPNIVKRKIPSHAIFANPELAQVLAVKK